MKSADAPSPLPAPPTAGVRLAHITDLHLLELSGLRPADLLGKRALGGLNLLTGRRGAYSWAVAEALVEDLLARRVDHVVVTGDLSNLSLEGEFRRVAALLSRLGDARRLSVIPGNHDRYTGETFDRRSFERHFAPYLVSDLTGAGVGHGPLDPYPWVKRLGPLALIGLCSARPAPWWYATGEVGEEQRARLAALLARPELAGLTPVVAVHHPLFDRPSLGPYNHRQLLDDGPLLALLLRSSVGWVLHGHNHLVHEEALPRDGVGAPPLHVVCGTSSTLIAGPEARRARYSVYVFGEDGRLRGVERRRWEAGQGSWVADAPYPEPVPTVELGSPDVRSPD